MPVLQWVGKDKVVNHHYDVPFRLLKKQYSFQAKDDLPKKSTDNRIIHGDNLEALKSLLPEFEGKINCIYIDPPYNTGNEGWVYNDNVNDPKIKKWLGEVVGKEGEDLSRHDKWLCMMYPRLKLLHRLLADNGVIFISIDDNEQANLKLVMDEIFGKSNFIAQVIWENGRTAAAHFTKSHEYIFCFAKNEKKLPLFKYVGHDNVSDRAIKRPSLKNPVSVIKFPKGVDFESDDRIFPSQIGEKEKMVITEGVLESKNKKLENDVSINAAWSMKDMIMAWLKGEIVYDQKGQKITRFFFKSNGVLQYEKEKATIHPKTIIGSYTTKQGTKVLESILGQNIFDFPKPPELIKFLLALVCDKDSLILDSFAGSGTTAHAVLKLNAEDGDNRRFICIEMMDYAEAITAERVRLVIDGYGEDNKAVTGLGGGFDFYTVDAPLFLEGNNLNEVVGVEVIRNYVAYTERLEDAQREIIDNTISPYGLGLKDNAFYVFYYERDRITTLDMAFLGELPVQSLSSRPEQYIIYADKCALEKDFMLKHGITFKRIPRDISRF